MAFKIVSLAIYPQPSTSRQTLKLTVLSGLLKLFRSGDTENSFHWAWDTVFHAVLDFVFALGSINRDSNDGSHDFLFILRDVCIFRGEEEAPGVSLSVPSNELTDKFAWNYGSVPYLFGYSASGYKTQAASISGSIRRPGGVVVRLYPAFVTKYYPDGAILLHLKRVYGVLVEANVANVDRLTAPSSRKNTATFEPRGAMVAPRDLLPLFAALRDVLQTLVALHRLGWIHRDIGWSNVLKHKDRDSWFLIDFVDSATSPRSRECLSVEEHAPEMFVDNSFHTTAVDIWAKSVSQAVNAARPGSDLMQQDPAARPNAEEALRELLGLQEETFRDFEKKVLAIAFKMMNVTFATLKDYNTQQLTCP
ncbi:hypothetical protein PHYSODRAFT_295364 [Phytophthora sojae]|uniref:Protein kinase domain-containing protein n=1 Tax=Phytophthora sojae (strain P6497) TaxID=1094619 RepID=G4YQZ5_PHYSP|nr:hypothetical protein PHYSODRAFT_295364 [Phytophthora sojae]EGZ30623.1 hypothetical protein PHYSODRAFT_295364 [Phytophthora sojae]|eukprot:XP_009517898.1 hypothetical protein PHYSODRAFT_295364 [Phytophthora sojae]